ncbi:hypothetical protein M427DRAFT_35270 [Gonapodya prolifera JEL478]|uniref:SH3 domain-containing protein n=1 Tax=Gonapodya prolifera (strain JEL478) TaxID=1344416 RepID=A0A139A595_GONPJ|nr:hypothetical protein M427DRAFT_35270 [Gonapodya prolifera JEL478]|eukprot:KXS11960.1 hypothetical protein M427DRAFT_35270 [Gonapodya prolifera JEL478]
MAGFVGCVVGGVVLVVGIIAILWVRRRRNRKSESQQNLVGGVPSNQQMQQPFAPQGAQYPPQFLTPQNDDMYMSQMNVTQQGGVQQNPLMAYAPPSGKSALQVQSPNSSKTLTVPSANLSKEQLDNIWKGSQGRVIQQFIPQNSDELVLNLGDIVVVGEAFPDGWGTGMNLMINSSGDVAGPPQSFNGIGGPPQSFNGVGGPPR